MDCFRNSFYILCRNSSRESARHSPRNFLGNFWNDFIRKFSMIQQKYLQRLSRLPSRVSLYLSKNISIFFQRIDSYIFRALLGVSLFDGFLQKFNHRLLLLELFLTFSLRFLQKYRESFQRNSSRDSVTKSSRNFPENSITIPLESFS